MKKGGSLRKYLKKYIISLVLILGTSLCLLTACGREEPVPTQLGVDGFLYVPKLIKLPATGGSGGLSSTIQVAGGYLYYLGGTDSSQVIKRIRLPEGGQAESLNFGSAETVLSIKGYYFEVPDEIEEGDIEALLDIAVEAQSDGGRGTYDPEKRHGVCMFKDYAADEAGRLYCCLEVSVGKGFDMEPVGTVLRGYEADGSQMYSARLPEADVLDLAVDGEGRALLLSDRGIWQIGPDGSRKGMADTESYRELEAVDSQRLYTDSEGRVYYVVHYCVLQWKGVEVLTGEDIKLREVKGLSGNDHNGVQGGGNGGLYFQNGGLLYCYRADTGTSERVLRWSDSDLLGENVQQIWSLEDGNFLIWYTANFWSNELYLLSRTAVEDMPEKELIVLASLSPSQVLQRAVLEYNRQSERYHCVIEQYGTEDGNSDGAELRMDIALTSSATPDILDLQALDFYKYARKDVLEDLAPYLERSSIDQEDILDGVRKGYTIDGKLVCVPTTFEFRTVIGRASQTDALESWTMEDVYALAEENPNQKKVLVNGYGMTMNRDFMLETFCSEYYLNKYIDWEKGECSFEDEDFGRLLAWIGEHAPEEDPYKASGKSIFDAQFVANDELLMSERGRISSILFWEMQFGEQIRLLGFPTVDGSGWTGAVVQDKLGMVSQSGNKEGAWDFLEYYIRNGARLSNSFFQDKFPTMKSTIREEVKRRIEQASENGMSNIDGKGYLMLRDYVSKERALELEEVLLEFIENIDLTPRSDVEEQVIGIVMEEAASYYNGDKSLEEVTAVIQNRVSLLLQERR